MIIRSIIVDDDPLIVQELLQMVREDDISGVEVLATFTDPVLAKDYIDKSQPDLLFLDIQMPQMSGFEMLDQLQYKNCEVIFITSYDEYAIRAIRYSAIDYLLKPISAKDLQSAIKRYIEHNEKIQFQTRLNNLKSNLLARDETELHLVVSTKQGEHRFLVNEIVRCEADSNYTVLHLSGERKFMASKTLGDIEEMLSGSNFLRVHKSHVVNPRFVEHLSPMGELIMKEGVHVPVSRRRITEVRGQLKN